jgi:hypothetical protein
MSAQQGIYACRIAVDREVFDVIEAVGWDPDRDADDEPIDVPLTDGHIEQLHHRRHDLGATNLDLLSDLDETEDNEQAAAIRAEITANRLAAQALDRLFTDYGRATAA